MGLFGKDKTTVVNGAVKLVSNIRGMIDDSKLTDEERVRYNAKLADSAANFAKDTLSESTERSRARRSIAIVTIYFFYALVLVLIVLWKLAPEWHEATKVLIIDFKLPTAFIMIMAFFFGGYYLNGYIKSQEKKDKS